MRELDASAVAAQFVEGLDYPITKREILLKAGESEVSDTIARSLANIADREYAGADDLTAEMNASRG
jgi:hypothetical protein